MFCPRSFFCLIPLHFPLDASIWPQLPLPEYRWTVSLSCNCHCPFSVVCAISSTADSMSSWIFFPYRLLLTLLHHDPLELLLLFVTVAALSVSSPLHCVPSLILLSRESKNRMMIPSAAHLFLSLLNMYVSAIFVFGHQHNPTAIVFRAAAVACVLKTMSFVHNTTW